MEIFNIGDFVYFGADKSPFNYSAGPLDISLNPNIESISVKINKNNINLYDEMIRTIKIAWNVKDEDITRVSTNTITIKTNYIILISYLSNIIFI